MRPVPPTPGDRCRTQSGHSSVLQVWVGKRREIFTRVTGVLVCGLKEDDLHVSVTATSGKIVTGEDKEFAEVSVTSSVESIRSLFPSPPYSSFSICVEGWFGLSSFLRTRGRGTVFMTVKGLSSVRVESLTVPAPSPRPPVPSVYRSFRRKPLRNRVSTKLIMSDRCTRPYLS